MDTSSQIDSKVDEAPNNGGADGKSLVKRKMDGVSAQFEKVLKYLNGTELHLTRTQAALILMSFSYGSAVIVLPNTVLCLGSVTWMLFVGIIITITGYCAYLNNQSTCYLLGETKSVEALRDPYLAIAELAGGPVFRKIVGVLMYVAMLTSSLAYMLLSASLLNDAFPFPGVYYYNSIRLWVLITCIPVAPLMYFGSFVDLTGAAAFAVTASSVSLLAVFVNCMVSRFVYDVGSSYVFHPNKPINDFDVFVTFGLITFSVAGPSFALPNILVHVSERKKFPSSIAYTFGILFVIYIFSGCIPYSIFGEHTSEMVTTTFWKIYKTHHDSVVLPAFTIICDVSMSLHLILESILVVNPLYQHIEEILDVPRIFNWKRVVVRTGGLLVILVCCLAFPRFRGVLSIVGGVPLTLVGIIFPLYIHTKIFDNHLFTKILHIVLGAFFTVFMVGNLGVTSNYLIISAIYTEKPS